MHDNYGNTWSKKYSMSQEVSLQKIKHANALILKQGSSVFPMQTKLLEIFKQVFIILSKLDRSAFSSERGSKHFKVHFIKDLKSYGHVWASRYIFHHFSLEKTINGD